MFLSTNFLGIPERDNTLEKSHVVVLPVPYERTVSYGVGTRNGPAAILEASRYVELYDALEILRRVAAERRIVGADVVEHAPLAGNRAPHFLVAKLCYKLLGYALFPDRVRSLSMAAAKSF